MTDAVERDSEQLNRPPTLLGVAGAWWSFVGYGSLDQSEALWSPETHKVTKSASPSTLWSGSESRPRVGIGHKTTRASVQTHCHLIVMNFTIF